MGGGGIVKYNKGRSVQVFVIFQRIFIIVSKKEKQHFDQLGRNRS